MEKAAYKNAAFTVTTVIHIPWNPYTKAVTAKYTCRDKCDTCHGLSRQWYYSFDRPEARNL
jgi:hypothetical protein